MDMATSSADSAGLKPGEAVALDDEHELARYSEFRSQDGQAVACSHFILDGMHCAACASTIERALRAVPGVLNVEVNAARQRAAVSWDRRRLRPSTLVAAVRQAGYQAYPDVASAHDIEQNLLARRTLWRLGVALFCMMQVMMYASPSYMATQAEMGADISRLLQWASWLLCLPVLIFSATPFYAGAWRALRLGQIGMDLPVVLGLWVAFAAGTAVTLDPQGPWGHEVYFDSVTMLVSFLLLGRWLEARARARASQALESVLHRLPASVERVDGPDQFTWVAVSRLRVGDSVRIAVGQAFAGDGLIEEGSTEVDESLLSGESRLLTRKSGERVLAGSLNQGAPVVMRIEQLGAQTQYERVVALMRQAVNERPPIVRAADRLAGPFLWAVLLLALGAGAVWWWLEPQRAVGVMVAVLIVTCPCALSLAAPSALIAAASALARRNVLVQRLDALEALARAEVVCFDKTGTLTEHQLSLQAVHAQGPRAGTEVEPERKIELMRLAAGLARYSLHPLSQALVRAAEREGSVPSVSQHVREHAGLGLEGTDAQGRRWRLGSAAWTGAASGSVGCESAQVWLCGDEGTQVAFEFDESVRNDARLTMQVLRDAGLDVCVLSGDHEVRVRRIAQQLGVTQWQAAASPEHKMHKVARLQAAGKRVVVVGDGINDAPVLALADVSFAMGHGAALAQARADFVVINSHPIEIAAAYGLARRTMQVIRQNFLWAGLYNLLFLPAAVVGWLPPWLAGLGMACSSLVVVLNALRLSRYQPRFESRAVSDSGAMAATLSVPSMQ